MDHVQYLRHSRDVELLVNGRPGETADIVHAHTVGPYAVLALLSSPGVRVVTAHVTSQSLLGSIAGAGSLQPVAKRYLSWFYNQADLVIAVSDYVKLELHQIGVHKPIVVVPNWLADGHIMAMEGRRRKIRNDLGLTKADTLIVTVGQVQPRKGVRDFLACARLFPEVKFLWVGGAIFGPASAEGATLERELRLGPPNVIHSGNVPRDRVYEYLAAGDVYISFSKQETFGLGVLEAAMSGLPLVLSDLPVFHATYGNAAQYGSVDRCTEILMEVTSDSTVRQRWAQRAKNVAGSYTWEVNGSDLLAIYRSLVREQGGRRIGMGGSRRR